MISINKQKFLAELGRLLTFMSEEDRQEALTLYAKMFDDVADEQALIQALLSPTRQAVIIARAYDANARKLQARAKARRGEDEDEETMPDFVLAILHVYEDCVPLLPEEAEGDSSVMADQFSLFDDDGQPTEESVYEEAFVLHEAAETPALPEDGEEVPPLPAETEEEEEEVEVLPPEDEEDAPEAEEPDEVDAFIANFSIRDDETAEAPAESAPLVLEESQVDSVDEDEEVRALVADLLEEPEGDAAPVRKPRVVLLVLFALLALPLTLLAVAVLLIPTLLSLILAAAMIAAGCAGLVAAIGGFPVLADILVVVGCAIIALALGLLFLWLFIWFVGTAIGGLIRSVIRLGGSWCYKEVAA